MITQEELRSIIRKNRIWDDTGATFIIIDETLKVLFVNNSPVDENTKMCPGDLLKCVNAIEETKGCGFHKNCATCQLRNMLKKSLRTKTRLTADSDMLVDNDCIFSVHVISTPFIHEGKTYAAVILVDKTDQYREFMMERIFFHDLINLTGALNGLLECAEFEDPKEIIKMTKSISKQLSSEIAAQRDLVYAKNGKLEPNISHFKANSVVQFIKDSLCPIAKERYGVIVDFNSTITDEEIESDKSLINRVLTNMGKNACEASLNSTITYNIHSTDDKIIFSVHNDAVIPAKEQPHIFIYGNSSKGEGRGLGTYSMKLIGETYLHGRIWFKSEEGFGTEFYFEIDRAK